MATHPRENVWDYPRPPRIEIVPWHIRVEHRGLVVVDAPEAYRVLETTHPPVYYVAPQHVSAGCLTSSRRAPSFCEWKGRAEYRDLAAGGASVEAVCWTHPEPSPRFEIIAGWFAFYASRLDLCSVDGERVVAQEGDFYGGWITSWIVGGTRGFKGGAGTWGW